ncbi:hypothetical protein WT38_02765 [Burkholderia territorii]|nr:hypothetical protein WT38_02765 [Burkholderia territorii]
MHGLAEAIHKIVTAFRHAETRVTDERLRSTMLPAADGMIKIYVAQQLKVRRIEQVFCPWISP